MGVQIHVWISTFNSLACIPRRAIAIKAVFRTHFWDFPRNYFGFSKLWPLFVLCDYLGIASSFIQRRQRQHTPVLLPGKSHGRRSLVGCSPWGHSELDTTERLHFFHFHALEKEMATHPSFLAWRVPGTGEPDGLPSMGLHRVGHDWSDLAAAAAVLLLCCLVAQSYLTVLRPHGLYVAHQDPLFMGFPRQEYWRN